mgnify:CR=1 FL=1|tara:strand:- start:365 stop:940 length:576 start_codon:yes stop_codon:yes gene_type:complete
MPINSPDIFDSIGDAVVTGGGSGSDTFVGLTDTPANYTSSADKIVVVNAGANGLSFVDRTFFLTGGLEKNSITERLIPFNSFAESANYRDGTIFLIPEKCEVVSVQIITRDDFGTTPFDVLKVAKSDLGTSSAGATPLESITLTNGLGGTTYTLNYSNTSTFDKNEIFALRWEPATNPSYTEVTITFKAVA